MIFIMRNLAWTKASKNKSSAKRVPDTLFCWPLKGRPDRKEKKFEKDLQNGFEFCKLQILRRLKGDEKSSLKTWKRTDKCGRRDRRFQKDSKKYHECSHAKECRKRPKPFSIPASKWARPLCRPVKGQVKKKNRDWTEEFDPGSDWTLAACFTHASRTAA